MEVTKKSKKKILSKHISYKEAVVSETATRLNISNIRVNSFYRSPKLNTEVRGSFRSSHLSGQAIDISTLGKKSNGELFDYIKENLDFDQLIWEFGNEESPKWIHLSFKNKKDNRKDVLKARYRGGKLTYFRM